ncbi:MAG: ATP-dependent zinc metalloprotease FtsH [Chloroflexota bacterium]
MEGSVNTTRGRIPLFYILLIFAIIVMLMVQVQQPAQQETYTINQLAADIQAGRIARIAENNDTILVIFRDVSIPEVETQKETMSTLVEQLLSLGVSQEQLAYDSIKIEIKGPSPWFGFINVMGLLLPIIVLVGVFWFVFRQAQGNNNAAMSFGKSKAKMFTGDHPTITFDDVDGVEEAKEDLMEIVEFLQEPDKFIELGARIPKGVLLVGQPGTGKTLMAKAVSGEAGVPFFAISGSEFVEMFVGVGASRVRDLFEQAKRHSPCIVFVDEIDAVGRQRGAGLGGSHDEREQTLNQMLVEMDGFETDTNIIIIAATNRPDILDPALMRPGRFDRRVILDQPDVRGREAILKVHTRGKPLEKKVDLSILARGTPGFVGADLENLVNEAAILAARRNKKKIGQDEFQEAIERVIAGPERKSRLISPEEKIIVAYHEAGHAIVTSALLNSDPVHKVTIVSRGMAGGYMLALPEDDRTMMSRSKMLDNMTMALGGRAAEQIVFDDITSGASNDIQQVTNMARTMVTQWGMSEKLGNRMYGKKEEMVFLGREISEQRDYSEAVAEDIDDEVLKIVNDSYKRAQSILKKYRKDLDKVAEALIEFETLTRVEFEKLFPPPVKKRIGGTPVLLNGAKAT